jgi:hypothetical protein
MYLFIKLSFFIKSVALVFQKYGGAGMLKNSLKSNYLEMIGKKINLFK